MKALISVHLPKIVFLLAMLPGMAMILSVHSLSERRLFAEFERVADLAVDRVVTRLQQHVVVLRAARGLLSAGQGGISRDEFVLFLSSVDIVDELSGVQGIGFARMLAKQDADKAIPEIREHYGIDVSIRPATREPWRTPIVLLEPANERNLAALGYDMYADPIRRSAMDHAIASGEAQMSGPVELVQEITSDKQTGFLIYLPFQTPDHAPETDTVPTTGFVYAPFRCGDLIRAALAVGPPLPLTLRIIDTGATEKTLFDDISPDQVDEMRASRTVPILGRQWRFELVGNERQIGQVRYLNTALLGLTVLLFAAAASYAVYARQNEAMQARAVAAAAARESDYRALMLQEMKHRIKNHISRIQSIARQSARGATDVKAFTTAFDARLQSMSAVQEILAGTAAAEAEVRAILVKELQQSLDAEEAEHLVDGPKVRLDERQAHAFAMVVHELVTNAMKYGGLSTTGSGLNISWSIHPATASQPPELHLDWVEQVTTAEPPVAKGTGFGSRLIEASLKGELSGTIEREFRADGLGIRITFPLSSALNPGKSR